MIVLEFKARTSQHQTSAIDEAIRTAQFIRNKCLRFWMDNKGTGKYDLNKFCRVLANDFPFAKQLNSMARQASAERAWSSISRFYENCKQGIKPVGFPRFKKHSRSVEYKTSGWKLLSPKKIKFTDGFNIGELRLIGTYDLASYDESQIKRVRLVRRADGYYVQFCISVDVKIELEPTGNTIGLDVGLESFYTDSNGYKEPPEKFYRSSQKKRHRLQKRLSRTQKSSANRHKAIHRLARHELKVSRQRKERAKRLALCVIQSNDLVVYENLRIRNMVKNHCLAQSIHDAGWYQFRQWLEYFGKKYGKVTVAVEPAYTSQECSDCGVLVKKSLSTRTHVCACGCKLDRDENAAINILRKGIATTGHVGSGLLDSQNASGDEAATVLNSGLMQQVTSLKEESPAIPVGLAG
ncbi:RNA-guided endonuclease TnpB family protein [Acaryochloris marina]|uniref:RNA-guided endonuclease InsQ/TnpB family protein n=1 Tax=Acaryochloris marina TaxID=155978 RepID=UPI001BB067E8|nr:RNA-guided endonuclease TnpB family protein [Acaryochloris marina]QUY45478.1 transposase [Acaryochloris marina S15]QUY45487.1 transposase [Acaryochloris marina S15]